MIVRILADYLLPVLLLIGSVALLAYVPNKLKYRDYCYVVMASLTSLLVGQLVSLVYQPDVNRPFIEKGVAAGAAFINNPGFPSDHVLLLTVLTVTVVVLVSKSWLSLLLIVGVALVAIGRVLALVHTPLDVIGGVIFGLIGGLWYLKRYRDQQVHVDS